MAPCSGAAPPAALMPLRQQRCFPPPLQHRGRGSQGLRETYREKPRKKEGEKNSSKQRENTMLIPEEDTKKKNI